MAREIMSTMGNSNYEIKDIYQPGYSKFKPGEDSPYLGKQGMVPANQIGLTTDPRMADQIAALSKALNQGVSVMEIGTLSPQVFETIPKQHFAEMRRKAKLANANLSFHAPIQGTDPSGFGQRGYEESNRLAVERQLKDVVDKVAVVDEKGNMPITIHGSNTAGSNWKYVTDENGKRVKKMDMLVAVDRLTGQLIPIKEEEKYYPIPKIDESTGNLKDFVSHEKKDPLSLLKIQNATKWEDDLLKIQFQRENADKILQKINPIFEGHYVEVLSGHKKIDSLSQGEYQEFKKVITAGEHIKEAEREMHAAFNRAYKLAKEDGNKEEMEYLKKLSEEYAKKLHYEEGKETPQSYAPSIRSEALFTMIQGLKHLKPNLFTSIEDFSIQKASDTFANVAMHAYDIKKDKAPALSIENLYQEMGFSQGEDLKNLVLASRNKFEKQLQEKKGLSESEAKKVAEKLIGVTFDVGHLNMSKKFGYTDKELVEEAKKVKPFVNKVHLTDNFGFNDSHLPPGMGNVPFGALMEALGEEGAKAIKINEVGGWFEHFKSSPFPQILEAYGSPIYSSGTGPYWSQVGGFQQSYLEGYGQMLPQNNYQTFGAGFSQLPQNLGGSIGQQGGGKMGGGGF